jgi:hypothetical protein
MSVPARRAVRRVGCEEYAKLPPYDGETFEQPPEAFFCHQQDGRLCAGWVGCHDMHESLAIRFLGLKHPEVAQAAVDHVPVVPLWGSGAEAAIHGLRRINDPDGSARRLIQRLEQKFIRKGQHDAG